MNKNAELESEQLFDDTYGNGFTLGMFRKRNGMQKDDYSNIEASDYNQIFVMGYEDGWEAHESAF